MEGKTEVADMAFLPFFKQKIHHSIINKPTVECFHSTATYGVKKVIVNVIRIEVLKRFPVHFHCRLSTRIPKIRKFCGNEIAIPRMSGKGFSCGLLAVPRQINGGSIEIIDSILQGCIHKQIDLLLVNNLISLVILRHRPSHTPVAQDAYFLSCFRIGP